MGVCGHSWRNEEAGWARASLSPPYPLLLFEKMFLKEGFILRGLCPLAHSKQMKTTISKVTLSKKRDLFVFLFLHILRHVERTLDDIAATRQSQVENIWSGLWV